MVPEPTKIEYPTPLDFPAPALQAYSRETVIAEKLEANARTDQRPISAATRVVWTRHVFCDRLTPTALKKCSVARHAQVEKGFPLE